MSGDAGRLAQPLRQFHAPGIGEAAGIRRLRHQTALAGHLKAMGALLALASAVCYGLVDVAGGLLSRRFHFAAVTFLGQVGGLLLALMAAALVPAEAVRTADLLWGALSGTGSGLAMHFLNRGLSRGAMSIVVPVSAVTGVALSVLCGVAVLGDRPSSLAWVGICLTIPALWLVANGSNGEAGDGRAALDGVIASAGVAVQYVGLAQAAAASGVWPVVTGRLTAVLILVPAARRFAFHFRQPARLLAAAAATGAGAAFSLMLYLWAAHEELLAIAVVLASLYPAIPTLLGITLLGEKVTRASATGLIGAGAAIVLLSLG
ncbi:EamA family transporter [Streptomyces sp. 6N223]|uniref:EamA family transporter n=1 Tax=Streptomyces sp. 6N223 TaxID=3457412 RepID=UPI003FD1303C